MDTEDGNSSTPANASSDLLVSEMVEDAESSSTSLNTRNDDGGDAQDDDDDGIRESGSGSCSKCLFLSLDEYEAAAASSPLAIKIIARANQAIAETTRQRDHERTRANAAELTMCMSCSVLCLWFSDKPSLRDSMRRFAVLACVLLMCGVAQVLDQMERANKGHNYEEMYINLRKEYDEMGMSR
jgi:hypothetical protein